MFSYALIRAITRAAVMPGRNSAGSEIDLVCEGSSEAVGAGPGSRSRALAPGRRSSTTV
jgi:hypothetical protein